MSAVLDDIVDRFTAYETYEAIVQRGDFGIVTAVYDCDGGETRHLFTYGLPIHSDQELIELLAVYDAGERAKQ